MPASESEERIRVKAEAMLRARWPGARIIHELVLETGITRIDLAAVTPERLVLCEIKSDRDVLDRMKVQLTTALILAHQVFLCIGPAQWPTVEAMMDAHVGPYVVTQHEGRATYSRAENPNYIGALNDVYILTEQERGLELKHTPFESEYNHLDPRAQLNLLWNAELRDVTKMGVRATRGVMIGHALEHLTGREIRRCVNVALRRRSFPRADPPFAAEVPIPPEQAPLF